MAINAMIISLIPPGPHGDGGDGGNGGTGGKAVGIVLVIG